MIDHLGLLLVVLAAGPHVADDPAAAASQPPATRQAAPSDDPTARELEHWARTYRIRVYQTFGRQRAEHDLRRAALYRVLAAWAAAGTPPAGRAKVIDWLKAAVGASTPGTLGPLPELPRFDTEAPGAAAAGQAAAASDPWAEAAARPRRPPERPLPPPVPAVAAIERRRSARPIPLRPGTQHVEEPTRQRGGPVPAVRRPAAVRSEQAPVPVARPPAAARRPSPPETLPALTYPAIAEEPAPTTDVVRLDLSAPARWATSPDRPGVSLVLELPAVPARVEQPVSTAGEGLASRQLPGELPARRPASLPASPEVAPRDAVALARRSLATAPPSESLPGNAVREGTLSPRSSREPSDLLAQPPVALLEAPVGPPGFISPAMTSGYRNGSAERLGLAGGVSVEPPARRAKWPMPGSPRIAEGAKVRLARRPAATRQALPPTLLAKAAAPTIIAQPIEQPGTPGATSAAEPRVRVNRTELGAQIAGHNLGLRALEAAMDGDPTADVERLAELVARLSRLAARRNDCRLVLDMLPEHERRRVGELESLQPVAARLERRIAKAQTRAAGPNFPGSDRQRIAELKLLDELARTLRQLSSDQ